MLNPQYAKKVVEQIKSLDKTKKELQLLSSEILSASKRSIFAIHREDPQQASLELRGAGERMKKAAALVKKESRLAGEGSWRAAQEEYAEADLLVQYASQGKVTKLPIDPEIFLGALSDLTGELVRRAVRLASHGKVTEVKKIHQDVEKAVELLLAMDLTGNLRSKTDQAKGNLRKLEEIEYDLSIRGRM